MLVAKANLNKGRKEFDRYSDLAKRGLVSESMFDGLKYDVVALQATYELKKLNYDYSERSRHARPSADTAGPDV